MTLVDSYSESNQNTGVEIASGGNTRAGQAFTGTDGTLAAAKFYLRKIGSPTGSAYVEIYSVTGTYGTNATPNALLATSDAVDVSTLGTSYALQTFTFSGAEKITLVAATKYFAIVRFDGGASGLNSINAGLDSTSPTHGGNYASYNGSWTGSASFDACFYVYRDDVSSPSSSESASKSTSVSPSLSPSLSPSFSPSISESLSPSISASISESLSISPTPPPPPPPQFQIRVAKAGLNVLTETNPNNFIFHSAYNTFKILKEGNAAITYTANGRYSFAHGLSNYSPTAIFLFIKFPDGYTINSAGQDYTQSYDRKWLIYDVYVDATEINMYIKRVSGTDTDLNFKYYIFDSPF